MNDVLKQVKFDEKNQFVISQRFNGTNAYLYVEILDDGFFYSCNLEQRFYQVVMGFDDNKALLDYVDGLPEFELDDIF